MNRLLMNALVLGAMSSATVAATAQYKWQTPDGKSVYSDQPPPHWQAEKDRVVEQPDWSAPAVNGAPASVRATDLPYELRVVAGRRPVVLYTAPECAPCVSARRQLVDRGIPFVEKAVATSADLEAFRRRGLGDNSFPVLTVGPDQSIGFDASVYEKLLDGAGYPRSSRLPTGYRHANAEPLTSPPGQDPRADAPPASTNPDSGAADPASVVAKPSPGVSPAAGSEPAVRF